MREMPYQPWGIFETDEYLDPDRVVDGRGIEADFADHVILECRLSDAECAAEYWRARLKVCARGNADLQVKGHLCASHKEEHRRLDVWHRFATHPHARENGYQ